MQLYSYYRSSAAFRVRIALNLKGLGYEYIPIHLLKDGGQQFTSTYQQINPQGLIPTLIDENARISQSLAILEYLEERYPNPALLPENIVERAKIRNFIFAIACDIHPLQNLRVGKYLVQTLNIDEAQKNQWIQHWIQTGFSALEKLLVDYYKSANGFCYGSFPTFADICLIPQVYNALRFSCSLTLYPTIEKIYHHCLTLPAFAQASPEAQPDFVL